MQELHFVYVQTVCAQNETFHLLINKSGNQTYDFLLARQGTVLSK